MKNKPSIAIDFDGVIHRYSEGWKDGTIYDVPVEDCKDSLKKLSEIFNVIIFTTRLNPELNKVLMQESYMNDWLNKYGFIKDVHYHKMTGYKPKAKIYLDDRAMLFTGWNTSLKEILEKSKNIQ